MRGWQVLPCKSLVSKHFLSRPPGAPAVRISQNLCVCACLCVSVCVIWNSLLLSIQIDAQHKEYSKMHVLLPLYRLQLPWCTSPHPPTMLTNTIPQLPSHVNSKHNSSTPQPCNAFATPPGTEPPTWARTEKQPEHCGLALCTTSCSAMNYQSKPPNPDFLVFHNLLPNQLALQLRSMCIRFETIHYLIPSIIHREKLPFSDDVWDWVVFPSWHCAPPEMSYLLVTKGRDSVSESCLCIMALRRHVSTGKSWCGGRSFCTWNPIHSTLTRTHPHHVFLHGCSSLKTATKEGNHITRDV